MRATRVPSFALGPLFVLLLACSSGDDAGTDDNGDASGGSGGAGAAGGATWDQRLNEVCVAACDAQRAVACESPVPADCPRICVETYGELHATSCGSQVESYIDCLRQNPSVLTFVCEGGTRLPDMRFAEPCESAAEPYYVCIMNL